MRSHRPADQRLMAQAATTDGVINRLIAVAAGLSERSLDRRLSTGECVEVYPGAYRWAAWPDSWRSRVRAAWIWGGRESFATGQTAAVLYGLDGVSEGRIEIACPTDQRPQRDVIVHRLRSEDRPVTRFIQGIRVASVERTMLDLCARSSWKIASLALDDALRKRMTTLDRLYEALEEQGGMGRKGTRLLRKLLAARDDRDGKLRTMFEARMIRILRRITQDFTVDHPIVTSARSYKLDFYIPLARLGIECHSLRWHFGEEKWKQDLRRHRDLTMLGITMVYFSYDDVMLRPKEVEAEIRALMGSLDSR